MANINENKNLTIGELLRYNLEERKGSRFNACGVGSDGNTVDITKVVIDGNEFTDYKAFSFVWEDSYVKSPERSGSGVIENLDSYDWFLTPHLKIDFSMLSIDSYRRLISLKHSKREFVVTCYDPSYNKMTTNKMYFPPEEMPKLMAIARALNGEEWVELLGVQDYSIELIGTNASLNTVNILYYDDNGNLLHSQTADNGTEAIIDFTFTPSAGKKFGGSWVDSSNVIYRNGDVIFVRSDDTENSNIKLTAVIINDNEYTLSFDYGLGNALITQASGELISIPIRNGETISTAIQTANIKLDDNTTFVFPENGTGARSVVYDGKTYEGSSVYYFAGWYWTTVDDYHYEVKNNSKFNYTQNRVIHQIYLPILHDLKYETNATEISISGALLGYGETVILPKLARKGYDFVGWYTTPDFKDGTEFSGTMPPYALTLYAKWE